METSLGAPGTLIKVLLTCGILAALIYCGTDILAGLLTPGYRFDSQSASVLSGSGIRTRSFMLPLDFLAGILMIAFAAGVWSSAGQNWVLRVMAGLLAGNAILTMVALSFFPMHPAEPSTTPANTMNVIIMAVGLFSYLFAISFGAAANQNWFRYFSIGTLLLFVLGAIFSLVINKMIPGGQPGPTTGIQERTMFYAMNLWLALQAIVLLRG